jgi:two-component system, NtrC family, sensor kinase
MRFKFTVIFMLAVWCTNAQFVFDGKQTNNSYVEGIEFIEDKGRDLSIQQVASKQFQRVTTDVPNFGMSASAYWLKFTIQNNSNEQNLRLQVDQPNLDELDVYLDTTGKPIYSGGERVPFKTRQFFDPSYIFRLIIPTGAKQTVYMRIASRDNFKVPVLIGTQETVFRSNKIKDYVLGILAGIMAVMLLYNMFLYVTVRDTTYLYYVFYLATVILTQISIQGYSFQYMWPESPWLAQWSPFIFSPLVGIASAAFMRVFLNTKLYIPRLDKGFKYFYIAYGVAFLLAVAGVYPVSYLVITLIATMLSMYMLVGAIVIFSKGFRPARYFLIAWSMFLFGVTIYAMTNLGVLPINNFTFYTMPAGAAAEVILLSLALADRINVLKKEKEESQAEALRVLKQNEQLITQQNVVLEQKVHERTVELEQANDELSKTLSDLKDTQAQLVDAEKMASLGQLTAGIAHEINNPINFVRANVKPLRLDIGDVLEIVHSYETITPESDIATKLKEIDSLKVRVDLEYIKKEIDTLLNGIEDGAKRTAEIVAGLKNFSRLDESDLKEANINDGIQSTLILIRSSIPQNVEVMTELGPLPQIECYPGKLNQVFMNLLTNAVYAVKMKGEGPQSIAIRTYERHNQIYAEFEDSGIGMTDQVKQRIFEPFFTTKDVGEGTGLGMSIVFKIVESHHAKMEIDSHPGEGTKLTLILNKRIT